MRRILFVDDEQNILDGLENSLRKERQRWHMSFVLGGEAALAELGTAAYNVIVTDMRMPGLNGAALLGRVKTMQPLVARIVLSGHAEQDALVQTLPVAHQVLGKPCDTDVLRGVVGRLCDLQRMLPEGPERAAVSTCAALPSTAAAHRELMHVTAQEQPSIGDLTRVVKTDPAMAVKVLQIVNSAYFSPADPVTSIDQAVTYLGVQLMTALVSAQTIFVGGSSGGGARPEVVQAESLMVAELGQRFLEDPQRGEEAFCAGLIQDVGRLMARPLGCMAGVSDPQTSAYLLGLWGLPRSLVEVAAHHRRPGIVAEGPFDVLGAVHVARALIKNTAVDLQFLERAGLLGQLPRWRALAQAAMLDRESRRA